MHRLYVQTRRHTEMVDISAAVQRLVSEAGFREGVCVLWSTHTTAALTVNENADSDVARDVDEWMTGSVPAGDEYHHREGNSDAHIKTSLMGPGLTLIVANGRIQLGRWQGIFLCEYDGPRERTVLARFLAAG